MGVGGWWEWRVGGIRWEWLWEGGVWWGSKSHASGGVRWEWLGGSGMWVGGGGCGGGRNPMGGGGRRGRGEVGVGWTGVRWEGGGCRLYGGPDVRKRCHGTARACVRYYRFGMWCVAVCDFCIVETTLIMPYKKSFNFQAPSRSLSRASLWLRVPLVMIKHAIAPRFPREHT